MLVKVVFTNVDSKQMHHVGVLENFGCMCYWSKITVIITDNILIQITLEALEELQELVDFPNILITA